MLAKCCSKEPHSPGADRVHHLAADHFHCTVVVAVISMRVVQPAIHEIVRMIAMGHRFMAAARTMHVIRAPVTGWFAAVRVLLAYRQRMLVVVTFVRVMQVPVVQVIDVSLMFDGRMTAAWAMFVTVMLVDVMFLWHDVVLLLVEARKFSRSTT